MHEKNTAPPLVVVVAVVDRTKTLQKKAFLLDSSCVKSLFCLYGQLLSCKGHNGLKSILKEHLCFYALDFSDFVFRYVF